VVCLGEGGPVQRSATAVIDVVDQPVAAAGSQEADRKAEVSGGLSQLPG
jgi:hypothetical protein